MIRAAELRKIAPLVRIRDDDDKSILEALEMGAEGIVMPFLQSAVQARHAARAMKYPPEGTRGTCTLTRAADFGAARSRFLEHTRYMNDRVLLVAQVEDREAAEDIDSIVQAVPGPDVFLVGRGDLAASYNRSGEVDAPVVLEAAERVVRAVGERGRQAGIGVYNLAEVPMWSSKGCRFFFQASDTLLLTQSARHAIDGFRHAVAQKI